MGRSAAAVVSAASTLGGTAAHLRQHVPFHEDCVACGPRVLRSTAALVEIRRTRSGLPGPVRVRLRWDHELDVLQRVQDLRCHVLGTVLVARHDSAADLAVKRPLPAWLSSADQPYSRSMSRRVWELWSPSHTGVATTIKSTSSNTQQPPRTPPPSKHQPALMIWLCVFPTLLALNLILGELLKPVWTVPRTFILATSAVPIVIYGLMPYVHKARARILVWRSR